MVRRELAEYLQTTWAEDSLYPILYFAVERNSPEIVRILCNAGANPSQRMVPSGISIVALPLLAYSVISAEYDLSDRTDLVISLLAMEADPNDIPKDMWLEYLKLPAKNMLDSLANGDAEDLWCTPELREALARNLNVMQRYVLWKANEIGQQTPRMKDIAMVHNITPLFETSFHIIGQRLATEQTLQWITDYFMFGDKTPLVLLFTGPSGHGKTELAQRMGDSLSLELLTIDCTEMGTEKDLFGGKPPYSGHEAGSRLNNYVAKKSGQRAVVFLDEFEKTTDEVRNALLFPLDSGAYIDRRHGTKLDCSKIIWILAANLGTEIIQKFWTTYLKDRSEAQQKKVSFTNFEKSLHRTAVDKLGAPLTGRFSAITPFMPFNAGEQAVAAYKFMRNLWNTVRKPINRDAKHLAGHLFLNYIDDGSIAAYLAEGNYSIDTGVRALQSAVNREIRAQLFKSFIAVQVDVTDDMNNFPLHNYDVRLADLDDGVVELSVTLKGSRAIQFPPKD